MWEAGVSRSVFPLQAGEARIRSNLSKQQLKRKKEAAQHHSPGWGKAEGSANSEHELAECCKGIPTETSANMAVNPGKQFSQPFSPTCFLLVHREHVPVPPALLCVTKGIGGLGAGPGELQPLGSEHPHLNLEQRSPECKPLAEEHKTSRKKKKKSVGAKPMLVT